MLHGSEQSASTRVPMFDSTHFNGPRRPGTREMTALLAGLMALNSFAIDAMIPALGSIGRTLHVVHENDRQLVVIAYFLGFAATQLIWGPLADRFGRKPVLGAGILLYGLFAALCAFATSFPLLIAGRAAMGGAAAVTRVLVVAMVRDLFEAEAMAKVMSLVFMVFMLMPVLAPNIGQLILLLGSWRLIFGVIVVYAVIMLLWSGLRLPETLHHEFRRPLDWRGTWGAVVETAREPQSRGYTLATAVSFSGLIAYISSVQQIVAEAFHKPQYIGLVFALVAAPMALASWLNSRVVGRYGLRRVGHGRGACVRGRHRRPRRGRAARVRDPLAIYHIAGPDDGLLRLHLVEPRDRWRWSIWRRSPARRLQSRASSARLALLRSAS